jgi:GMP synthase PP-ATPase subunit
LEEKAKRAKGVSAAWESMTPEERNKRIASISASTKGKQAKSKNPNAVTILVDGTSYGSWRNAEEALGKSSYYIKRYHNIVVLGKTKDLK